MTESRVFRPPNPWVMPLLNTLKELYDVPDIKLSIKFELEVRVCVPWCVVVFKRRCSPM